jgi:CRP-like cAMP-binding protein
MAANQRQADDDDPFAHSKVLGILPPTDRHRLTERCVERRFDKGQIVYFEGQTADSMQALVEGHLKVSTFSSDGNELVISTVNPGEIIGELGVLSTDPRSATVTATTTSRALVLTRAVVMELIEERPAMAVAMLCRLADMVRKTTEVASDLVFLDLNQRVAKFLIEKAPNPSAELRIIQSDLAAAIGASRQRVNASLQEFQRRGWISLGSRTVRIVDPEALHRVLHA